MSETLNDAGPEQKKLTVVCAYCKTVMEQGDEGGSVSHGLCRRECFETWEAAQEEVARDVRTVMGWKVDPTRPFGFPDTDLD